MRWAARLRELTSWQPWFAWHPVLVDDLYYVWLVRVERRLTYTYASEYWEYRACEEVA